MNFNLLIKKGTMIMVPFLFAFQTFAQKGELTRIDPPNWWIGMENNTVQLMATGENIGLAAVSIDYAGVSVVSTTKLESDNYLFIDLLIDESTNVGSFPISLNWGKKAVSYNYHLGRKNSDGLRHDGLNSSDVMYLIMPDRFANGDPSTDDVVGMTEKADRSNSGGKHGGDIKGIHDRLDYIKDLGVTTIWLNPVFENNMNAYSYHGYSITDHYRVDPRYGTVESYMDLVAASHERGLKVVKDMVFNHIGLEHFWMKDLPSQDWVHQFSEFTQTNFEGRVVTDPNASDYDSERMLDGWFVKTMPDLNQKNPQLMKYLIQNSIWWIEQTGLNGIRMDTYPYPDRYAMAEWVNAVLKEYPEFYLVGETWLHGSAQESYWQGGAYNRDDYDSYLPSISDFPVYFAIDKAFAKGMGVNLLYQIMTEDFLYPDANMNKIFIDNHDVDRFYGAVDRDLEKIKLAMAFVLTTRGIPQLFYGTEVLMEGMGDHGDIREDFMGGWQGDERDAFTAEGRTDDENEMFNYMRTILNWRQQSQAIENGKLKHFIPELEMYVYGKFTEDDGYIVVLNNSQKVRKLGPRYDEMFEGYSTGTEIISSTKITDFATIEIAPKSAIIIDLDK